MFKMLKEKKIIIIIIAVAILVFIGLIIMQKNGMIKRASKLLLREEEVIQDRIEYVVYDNRTEKIKTLVRISREEGIESIKYGEDENEVIINCNGKKKVSIDFQAYVNKEYEFKVTSGGVEQVETLVINENYIDDYINIKSSDVKNINIQCTSPDISSLNSKYYYKYGENGAWIECSKNQKIYVSYNIMNAMRINDNEAKIYTKIESQGNQIIASKVFSIESIYGNKFLNYTWEELAKVAKEISNNDETITRDTLEVKLEIDGKNYELKVGDITRVNVNGALKVVRIMGFNHDTLTDSSAYGNTNTYAGISFEFMDSILYTYMKPGETTTSGGWAVCTSRATLNNTTINTLNNKDYIKQVQKSYIETYNNANSVKISNDKLWLLSCSEIWNSGWQNGYGMAITKEGEQYKYYKDVNANWSTSNPDIVKNSDYWWLRSPSNFWFLDRFAFCIVMPGGDVDEHYVDSSCDVYPAFAI